MKKIVLCVTCLILLISCAEKESIVNITDKTPPWITVEKYFFETTIGAPINLETAVAYDAIDGHCDVVLEGIVNFKRVGEYYLTYISKDMSGNVSEETITVVVRDEHISSQVPSESNIKKDAICDVSVAIDALKSCNTMITDTSFMKKIFQDETGLAKCEALGNELIDNEEIQTYTCDKLFRNDSLLWGYGLTTE